MLKLLQRKKYFTALTVVLAAGLFLLLARPAQAVLGDVVDTIVINVTLTVVGAIVSVLVWAIGQLMIVAINALIYVAQFNNFIGSQPVVEGWIIVRDLCNMFFVLVLLAIAFATILHLPNYSIKKLLPRVIIFAILINFSKMICGLIIDFSQVIMLTFVNAFKDIGAGNLTTMMGVDKLLAIDSKTLASQTTNASFWSVVVSYILALIYVIIMLVVIVALLATLVYRIVMLWIYIILSPIAYLAAIVPMEKGLSKKWWTQFTQQVATGPLLAFFIWLSLATLGQFGNTSDAWVGQAGFTGAARQDTSLQPVAGITEIGTVNHMIRFIISIGLLIGGLVVSKSFGGSAGAAMSQVVGKAQSGAGWLKRRVAKPAAKWVGRKAWQGTKAAGRGGLTLAKTVDRSMSRKLIPGYQHDQGVLTRGAGWGRENLLSKEGWKRNLQKATRAVGWETNGKINHQRSAADAAGYHDEGGVRYKKQADGRYKSDNNQYWLGPDGKPIQSFGDFGGAFHRNLHAMKSVTARDAAAAAKDKTDLEELAKPYKDMPKEQLWSLMKGTVDPNKLKGMGMALASEGNFQNTDMVNMMRDIFAKGQNPNQMKAFLEAAQKKQAFDIFDLTNADQKAALSTLIKKGKIKLSDQNLAGVETDNAGDKKRLADMLDVFRDSLHKERWSSEIGKIDKEGDPKVAQKMSDALGLLSGRKEEQRDVSRVALGNILSEINEHKNAMANLPEGEQKRSHARDIETLEDEAAMHRANIDKLDREVISVRADQLTLDLKGDPVKSFTNRSGVFDEAMFKKWASQASVKQLSQINPEEVAKSPQAQRALAEAVTFEKLKGLQKSNNNPVLVRSIAQAMAAMNHPEAEKIMYNIANDIDVDMKAAAGNKEIQEFMRKNGLSGLDNLTKIDQFRRANGNKDKATREALMLKYFNKA